MQHRFVGHGLYGQFVLYKDTVQTYKSTIKQTLVAYLLVISKVGRYKTDNRQQTMFACDRSYRRTFDTCVFQA